MGKPIRLHPRSKEVILDLAESLVRRDALDDEVRAALGEAIERARQGTSYDINVLPLVSIIDRYGTEEDRFHLRSVSWFEEWDLGIKRFASLNGPSKGELLNDDFTYSFLLNYPLSEGATYGIASSRVSNEIAPLRHDPSDIVLYALEVFGSEKSARGYILEKEGVSAFDYVHAVIQERILNQLIDLFRNEDGEIRIPPPPFTDRFYNLMMEKLDVDLEKVRNWERSPNWKPAIAAFFAELLARGVGSEELTPYSIEGRVRLRNRAEARGLKEGWYRALERESFESSYLKDSIEQRFPKGSRERVLALAWLGHFDPELDLKFEIGELTTMAEILEEEISVFHRIAPGVEGEGFTDLLTPLARRMDICGVKKILSYLPNGTGGFRKFKALNIFGWHADEPANFARWIAERIEVNKKHEFLDGFLSEMFDVSVVDFSAKMHRLENQHVDTKSIVDAVTRNFPHMFDEYPEFEQAGGDIGGIVRTETSYLDEDPADAEEDVEDDETASVVSAANTSLRGGQLALPFLSTYKPVS